MEPGRWPYPVRIVVRIYSGCFALAAGIWFVIMCIRSLLSGRSLEGVWARFGRGASLSRAPKHAVWLHAVSAGEVAATAIMIPVLRASLGSDVPIVLSTATHSGMQMAEKRLGQGVTLIHAPLDLPRVTRRFVARLEPALLAVAEIEIWPNLFRAAVQGGVPLMVYNARLPDRDWKRYSRFRWIFAPVLSGVRLIAAQSAEDASRYCDIGAATDRVLVAGNIKNDQEFVTGKSLFPDFGHRPVILLASSHPGEEEMLLESVGRGGACLVIAPRHITRADRIAGMARRAGFSVALRSGWGDHERMVTEDVMILDTFGEMMQAAERACCVVMGGSFSKRVQGHNPMEAAASGRAVIMGPCMDNFRESRDALVAGGAAVVVSGQIQLAGAIRHWLQHPGEAEAAGQRARAVLESLRGASRRTAELMANLAYGRKKFDSCHRRG